MAARTTALTFDKRGLGRAHRISAAYQWHPVTVPQLSQLAASINCSGLGIYSASSIMPGQCSHRDMQHAAPIQVPREGTCCCE